MALAWGTKSSSALICTSSPTTSCLTAATSPAVIAFDNESIVAFGEDWSTTIDGALGAAPFGVAAEPEGRFFSSLQPKRVGMINSNTAKTRRAEMVQRIMDSLK